MLFKGSPGSLVGGLNCADVEDGFWFGRRVSGGGRLAPEGSTDILLRFVHCVSMAQRNPQMPQSLIKARFLLKFIRPSDSVSMLDRSERRTTKMSKLR